MFVYSLVLFYPFFWGKSRRICKFQNPKNSKKRRSSPEGVEVRKSLIYFCLFLIFWNFLKYLLYFRLIWDIMITLYAGVLELVDEVDSKSSVGDNVRVRVPPPALLYFLWNLRISEIFLLFWVDLRHKYHYLNVS